MGCFALCVVKQKEIHIYIFWMESNVNQLCENQMFLYIYNFSYSNGIVSPYLYAWIHVHFYVVILSVSATAYVIFFMNGTDKMRVAVLDKTIFASPFKTLGLLYKMCVAILDI
jgi:hypothetical protein